MLLLRPRISQHCKAFIFYIIYFVFYKFCFIYIYYIFLLFYIYIYVSIYYIYILIISRDHGSVAKDMYCDCYLTNRGEKMTLEEVGGFVPK